MRALFADNMKLYTLALAASAAGLAISAGLELWIAISGGPQSPSYSHVYAAALATVMIAAARREEALKASRFRR